MASYNTVITNEGAALLASVIANQGTLTFSEMRFSTTDYDGVEQTLTVGTFAGVFITAAASGSVVDATTIKVGAQFDNSGIVGDHPLYSIGIVGTDGNTTALIAVCTTTNPDIIRAALTGVSTYAFNVNLAVSSTSNITVTGTTAAVLYDTDVVDTLISTATDKPLSANMGRVLGENVEAIVDVYGAKNILPFPYNETTKTFRGVTYTVSDDGIITTANTATNDGWFTLLSLSDGFIPPVGSYTVTGCPSGGSVAGYVIDVRIEKTGGVVSHAYDVGNGATFTIDNDVISFQVIIGVANGTDMSGLTFYPMIRDARITDPTFVPFAKTNLQLTNDKAERADLATLNLTGSTNSTGSTINAGTYFYLNGSYCKAKTNIANGATFTLNANFEVVSVGGEISSINDNLSKNSYSSSGLTTLNCTINYGGFARVGNIVFVAIRFTQSGSNQPVIEGLPKIATGTNLLLSIVHQQSNSIVDAYIASGSDTFAIPSAVSSLYTDGVFDACFSYITSN